jgi:hypothetical protein
MVERVDVSLPPWLFAGDTNSFMGTVGWDATSTTNPLVWQIALEENATVGSRKLLTLHEILGPRDSVAIEEHAILAVAAAKRINRPMDLASLMRTEIDRIGPVEKVESLQDLTKLLYLFDMLLMASDEKPFSLTAQELMVRLRSEFPHAALYFVEVDGALSFRTMMTRVLMRLRDEPATFTMPPLAGPGGLAFEGGSALTDDLSLGLRAFIEPLLLSLSPFAWGHSYMCDNGVLIVSFGCAIAGRSGEPNEILNQFGRPGGVRSGAPPTISSESITAAIEWWIEKLNSLLSSATDLCRYRAIDGSYDVVKHQESLFTLIQAFRAIQSISVQQRDGFARQTLFFNALDTLEMLSKVSFDQLVEAPIAQRTLSNVLKLIPTDAQAVLLPRAADAVDALVSMRKSLGIGGRVSSSGITVPGPSDGGPPKDKKLTFDRAVAQYLRIRRNATHGYGGRLHKDAARDRVLLFSHSGHIPEKVADLSYLYALNLLTTGLN